MPDATVVIPSYNGAAKLPRLLRSLEAQRGADWDAIVVLDGSTDDSFSIVRWAAQAMPVRCIDLGSNQGRPAALNTGFAEATGRVLIRCDDDLELPETFVRNHVGHHAGDPVGVIGMCPDVFGNTKYAKAYGQQADENIRKYAYALPSESRWRLWSANVSVTRETYDRVGPYDEDYRVYGWEDVDWGYRLKQAGIPVVIARDVEALHHAPAPLSSVRAGKAFESGASAALFRRKHPEYREVRQTDRSAWSLGVSALASVTNRVTLPAIGRIADRAVQVLPTAAARKVAAATVESAARAGEHSASSTPR